MTEQTAYCAACEGQSEVTHTCCPFQVCVPDSCTCEERVQL